MNQSPEAREAQQELAAEANHRARMMEAEELAAQSMGEFMQAKAALMHCAAFSLAFVSFVGTIVGAWALLVTVLQ